MDRQSLLHYLKVLGVEVDQRQSNDRKIVALCPFAKWRHKRGTDSRPSFAAFANEERVSGYKCMACHSHGSMRKLVVELSRLRGKDYSDLLPEINLSEEYALSHFPEYEDMLKGDDYVEHCPDPLEDALYEGIYPPVESSVAGYEYIRNRGISTPTAQKLGLCFDDTQSRVLFPVYGRSSSGDPDLYGFTGRSVSPDDPVKVRDYFGLPKRHLVLGEHLWDRTKPVFLVEGLFGYAHLHEIGAATVANIGAILGSHLTTEKAEKLINFGKPVYLMLDNDDGGEIGLFGDPSASFPGAIALLDGFIPLFVPSWPDGKIDPDQLTLEEVVEIINATPPYFK